MTTGQWTSTFCSFCLKTISFLNIHKNYRCTVSTFKLNGMITLFMLNWPLSTSVASYLDLLFTRDRSNNITTKLYDKRDAFGFHIVKFPFMSSNIPSAPAYGVYASQLIRYARCCSNYSDFLIRHRALVKRLLSQGYKVNRLSNTFKKFYGRHTDLVGQYKKNVCQMFADSISWNDFLFWWICQWPN